MTEIAKVRESHAAIVENSSELFPIKTRGRQSEWPVADEQQNNDPTNHGEQRHKQHVVAPIRAPDAIDQIRRRFPERECPDQHTQRQASAMTKPRRENLH